MDLARDIIRRQERLAGERAVLDSHWQEIADLMAPFRADIALTRQPGEKRGQKILDNTAQVMAAQLAAGLWGLTTNSATDWFHLAAEDEGAERDFAGKTWLDAATRRMRAVFDGRGQRFYRCALALDEDLVTFGTAVFYAEESAGEGINFHALHPAECFIAENEAGAVDTLIRKFRLTARQAARKWGAERAGKSVAAALREGGDPDRKLTFLHAVMPREDVDPGRRDWRGMPFRSCYVALADMALIDEGGYREFPYQVPRWSVASGGAWGESPAMAALAEVKMLMKVRKTGLLGAELRVLPPLLAADEKALGGVRTHPGAIIYGGLDAQGNRRYQPLYAQANDTELGLAVEAQCRQAIRDAFHDPLFTTPLGPARSATEIVARREEQMRLMAPYLARLHSEFLDPLIDRVFAIMMRARQFGPLAAVPEALLRSGLRLRYTSPLARAQRAAEAGGIAATLQAWSGLAAVDRGIFDNLDADAAARAIAAANGFPNAALVDPETVAARRRQRRQAMLAETLAATAGGVAGAVRDLAAAERMAAQP